MKVRILSDYKKTIERLLNSQVSAYKIHQETGVSTGRISDLRNGKRELEGITLQTAEKLYAYQCKIEG
ncbi:hypothetical protein [Staphylococcus delphini]|uniref:hypothetical protein n=1 Tax=Staphylococcus delphini TaxID=53344 RepID=UPI0026C5B7CE